MPIDASIFAHILNDSSLSGTYGLTGNHFVNTVGYLNEYLDSLAASEEIPPEYQIIREHTHYLVKRELEIDALRSLPNCEQKLRALSQSIQEDLTKLADNEYLLLPGGWHTGVSGHGMIYQFTRNKEGYHFTLFNAGGGLEYHAKKSSLDKERYNPTKTWHIPFPNTPAEKNELALFLERLFKARLPHLPREKPIDGKVLYEEILPSISYLNGSEIENKPIPDYGYTGGQLSGTCAQRSLHQMLKLNSRSAEEYQRFIFKFKHYALNEYTQACLSGKQSLNEAVVDQIRLAIENNYKILNTPDLFNDAELAHYQNELTTLEKQLAAAAFTLSPLAPKPTEKEHLFTIDANPIQGHFYPGYSKMYRSAESTQITSLGSGIELLATMDEIINTLERTNEPATRFAILQQVLLELPCTQSLPSEFGFFSELRSMDDFHRFQEQLNKIQIQLTSLEKSWLNQEPNPIMNIMLLCLMSLNIQVNAVKPKGSNLLAFTSFSSALINSILSNQNHNAFYASNHPGFDEKLIELRQTYDVLENSSAPTFGSYYRYYNDILATEPEQMQQLKALYHEQFGGDNSEQHQEVRKNKLEALFMIAEDYNARLTLADQFKPLIAKVQAHLKHEENLRALINPFYVDKFERQFTLAINHKTFRINTALFPIHVPYLNLLTDLPGYKYKLSDSPARKALIADISAASRYSQHLHRKIANEIQLTPGRGVSAEQVSQDDIIERDYFHLRSEPKLQIALTLDYFNRNIERCADVNNQRYIEANLFQPGLLLSEAAKNSFRPQFDRFIQSGIRYFTENGLLTSSSLFYLRLDYLVSRYLHLNADADGSTRLSKLQAELEKRLTQANTPEITYVLNQYLFLTLMERIKDKHCSEELFTLAYQAYIYIQGHSNPQILEDKAHQIEVETAIARFKPLIAKQTQSLIEANIKQALSKFSEFSGKEFTPSYLGQLYLITKKNSLKSYKFNVISGKLYEEELNHHNLPFKIRVHPLINHLGLDPYTDCFINADESYITFTQNDQTVALFHSKEKLIAQKEWTIAGVKEHYELQALSKKHQAYAANKVGGTLNSSLPKILRDGSMDYWQSLNSAARGILVRNNVPIYALLDNKLWELDAQGNKTGAILGWLVSTKENNKHPLLNFESSEFVLAHNKAQTQTVDLPRYALHFSQDGKEISYPETGEVLSDAPSPIHPCVAGLLLTHKEQTRYLVPIARFYAVETDARNSDFYPVIHDRDGTIASSYLANYWKNRPAQLKPLWHYQNSETYVSYQLRNGEPIAENVADALYLVYIYLACNQTEQAWKLLDECTTRFGGLSGDAKELHYIYWICKQLPHILPGEQTDYLKNKPQRKTPPYVACQLKAMALLSDYLNQNGQFNFPSAPKEQTANTQYEQLEQRDCQLFLKSLPRTIYQSFTRLQTMRRHLAHTYSLSMHERKNLLAYYHNAQNNAEAPKGALGAEWLRLNLETLLAERDALLARASVLTLAAADQERLSLIEQHLAKQQEVSAHSTALQLVAIPLHLLSNSDIHLLRLQKTTRTTLDNWLHRLPGDPLSPASRALAVQELSSAISEDDFVLNFPAYLQQALTATDENQSEEEQETNKRLRDKILIFCRQTLISTRHTPIWQQENNIPILCNVLYHILSQPTFKMDAPCKFNELIERVKRFPVASLAVYEACDVHKDILLKPDEVIAQQQMRPKAKTLKLPKFQEALIKQTGIEAYLDSSKGLITALIQEYQQAQEQNETALNALEPLLTQGIQMNLAAEEKAGSLLFDFACKKKDLAQKLLAQTQLTKVIIKAATQAQNELKKKIDQAWTDALKLANEGPADPKQARKWALERQAQSRARLTKTHLLALYAHADLAQFIAQTGLNEEKSKQLHQSIHQALSYGIQNQVALKIKTSLEKAEPNTAVQALDLLSRTELPGNNEPAMMLLQHEEQILLHQRQNTALSALLEPNEGSVHERIEKIIMGGGKSKVILPLLAEKKAQGDNLVVIEVPQALLATNHVDLNHSSQRLFGKRAYRFEFNRDSDCSPKRLEQMYKHFTDIMTSRCYLVTAGESVQSLELKYIELLLANQAHDETWKQQVYWCDKITKLFRHHTDCVVDEVHLGLSLKKKLNYTVGEPQALASALIKDAVALYGFISQELITAAPSFDKNHNWEPFKQELADKLLSQANSPLSSFVSQAQLRYGHQVKAELQAYLTNSAKNMPPAVLRASAQEQASLAFFKQEISTRLPQTLSQKLDKDYGASRRAGISAREKTLAIPYAGNNIPNERNRFANETEALNKCIQMMLLTGISKELLIERIVEWQALAHQELFKEASLQHLEQSPTAQGFAVLTAGLGLKLSQLNPHDAKQMDIVHQHLRYNRPLIFDCLKESSLKLIQQNPSIIPSDNFNHADQYRSVQGVSGTPPWNDLAYHGRLHYDKKASLGTDSYIFEVIRNKNPRIKGLDYQNNQQFVHALLSQSVAPQKTRAIIDIKGAFTGVSNLEVAQALAAELKNNPSAKPKPLKQVLYFNEQQVLCAIDIQRPHKPIILGSSDPAVLKRILDSQPEERFTYFDQIHTTGTDISQQEDAHAIVLVDDKNGLQEFLQGEMRLRQLELSQTMELIVPERMKDINLAGLYQQLKTNDESAVFRDTPNAAKDQMRNHIRREFLTLIQNLPSEEAEKKATLIKQFRAFFENNSALDLFAFYGGLKQRKAAKKILDAYKEQIHKVQQSCLLAAEMAPYQKEIDALSLRLEQIITKALPFCLTHYDSNEDSFAQEVEVQKEVQKEIEVERFTLDECYDSERSPVLQLSWREQWIRRTYFSEDAHKEMTIALNEACTPKGEATLDIFSPQLRASKNYLHCYENQTQALGLFLKPVFLVWYHRDDNGLHATIITPQEAEELRQNIQSIAGSWISTTDDTVTGGSRPEGMLAAPQYQALKEQVRFFNGEFNSLLSQETPLHWLSDDPSKKLSFFNEKLMAIRPGSTTGFKQFQTALTQGKAEGFAYISAHPFEDLSQFNWSSIFPKTLPVQAKEYQKLAEAFTYLNKSGITKLPSIDELQQQFTLPINSLAYVDRHLKHLHKVKELLNHLLVIDKTQPLTIQLSAEHKACLEYYINLSLEHLYSAHEPQLASLKALVLFSLHPLFKDKLMPFQPYFEQQAQMSNSKEQLLTLLEPTNPSTELLHTVVNHPLADTEVIDKLLELNKNIDSSLSKELAKKCTTPEQVARLLRQTQLNNDFVLELLNKHSVRKNDLLVILANLPTSPLLVQALLKQNAVDEDVLLAIADTSHPDSSVLHQLIEHPQLGPEVADELIHFARKNPQFLVELSIKIASQLIEHPETKQDDFFTWDSCFSKVLALLQEWELCDSLIPLLHEKQAKLAPALCIKLIKASNEQLLSHLPQTRLIDKASEEELKVLSQLKSCYSSEHLKQLALRVTSKETIEHLLKRLEMTAEVGDILLAKSNYNGEIGPELPWLKPEQIMQVLTRTTSYSSLHYGLNHPQVSDAIRAQWLASWLKQQKERPVTHTPQQKLQDLLEDLKIKAVQHAIKAISNPNYAQAAETAFRLYQFLYEKTQDYLKNPQAYPDYRLQCQKEIGQAKDILEVHRGYKQVLLDIVNALFALVSLLINKDWRFFKAKTASVELVEQIQKQLTPALGS